MVRLVAIIVVGVIVLSGCDRERPLALEPDAPSAAPTGPSFSVAGSTVSHTELAQVAGVTFPESYGEGINESGWVAGWTRGYFGWLSASASRATLWTPAGPQNLGVLPPGSAQQHSWASDVNDAGMVTGYTTGVSATGQCCTAIQAFVWTAAEGMRALPRLAPSDNAFAQGRAINSAGQVAGIAYDAAGAAHAVVWKGVDQVPVSVVGPGTARATFARASSLNDAGQVVGVISDGLHSSAFRWSESGGVEILGHLGGGDAEATSINTAGHVVGFSTVIEGVQHPFLWTPETGIQDLGLPPGMTEGQATAINDAGHIAVSAAVNDPQTGEYTPRAWLWVAGTWIDLGDGLGWSGAGALNEQHQVTGYGLSPSTAANAAVRWTVVPPRPSGYDFAGFFAPVDNLPAVNRVKAGSSVPVKFSLGGDRGLDIFAPGYPASQPIACDASAPLAAVEQTAAAGGSGLSYDPVSGQYTYVWKTERSWTGSCRRLTVRFDDGSEHSAEFNFTR